VLDIKQSLAKSNALRIPFWFYSLALLVLAQPISPEFMFAYSADRKMIFKPVLRNI